jgi:hypothetical protein
MCLLSYEFNTVRTSKSRALIFGGILINSGIGKIPITTWNPSVL